MITLGEGQILSETDIRPRGVYNVAEAATTLRMSRATLYRLAGEGKIPHRRIAGTGIRFTQADIDAILEDAARPAVAS